jgi:electron transfer flavoprotein alpha subunit
MMLVYAEHDRGTLEPLTLQALTFARALGEVQVLIVGAKGADCAPELAEFGAESVTLAASDLLDYTPLADARAIVHFIEREKPEAVIAASTPRGNEVMSHVAAILDEPMVSDCIQVTLGNPAHVIRARWAGNLLEEANVKSSTLLATVQPHAVEAQPAPSAGTTSTLDISLTDADRVVAVMGRSGGSDGGVTLADAKVIVSGGRGMGGPESFALLDELAELLGGTVGCSRVVTSAGWRPHAEQVGQTGTKVAPELYIACGISGATQHLAGCKNSKTLIAINTDAQAPIMTHADYVVVGDVHQVLPDIIAAVKAARS